MSYQNFILDLKVSLTFLRGGGHIQFPTFTIALFSSFFSFSFFANLVIFHEFSKDPNSADCNDTDHHLSLRERQPPPSLQAVCLMPHDDYDDEYGEQSDVKVNESKEAVLHDLESVPLWRSSGDRFQKVGSL